MNLTQEDKDFIYLEIKKIYWAGFKRGLIFGMLTIFGLIGWILYFII